MEPLKNIYSTQFIENISRTLTEVIPAFDEKIFQKNVFDNSWKTLELKERMSHIVETINLQLPNEYKNKAELVLKLLSKLEIWVPNSQSYEWMFLPEFIEKHGLDDFETSVKALEKITQFTSCEFAVRPFILRYPEKMIGQMKLWSSHKNEWVRRLATEGCRPRLPWAMAIPFLKKDPKPILPILEKLKNDTSLTVRRSVANNINDIAKDNPETVIKIAKKWHGKSENVNWVVKHACRTLLKQGNQEIMPLFGFGSVKELELKNMSVLTPNVKIGESLEFEFLLVNKSNSDAKLRVEYGIYYQKANGTLARKVFKISEKRYNKNSENRINKKQSFKIISTRKFHPGLHQVSIIINGKEMGKCDFHLI